MIGEHKLKCTDMCVYLFQVYLCAHIYFNNFVECVYPNNKYIFRYLIFFDDGYSQYVTHDCVHLIYDAHEDIWEDINVNSRAFIKKYLEMYPERPMVKLMKNQSVRTEYNGTANFLLICYVQW